MAKALEILPLAVVPHFLIKKTVLNPLRKQTGGTVLVSSFSYHTYLSAHTMFCVICVNYCFVLKHTQAGKLAKDRGWAINIGGGFHHCCSNMGGRFCVYADISLCVKVIIVNYM